MSTLPIEFYEQPIETEDAKSQLIRGLKQATKSISPKFFYDEKGSELFTEITRTAEYYPTRTEIGLLKRYGSEISKLIGENCTLIEYGSGSSEKIRILLESLKPAVYAPLDISRDYLMSAAHGIASEFPWLDVKATCVDYSRSFELPFDVEGHRAGFFPGSSIGNFDPEEALGFLKRARRQLGSEGGLLIGVDLKKNHSVLNAAYNDARGVTAEFNLNILAHINREYEGTFNLEAFEHRAEYNEDLGCIQMFLVSKQDQVVRVAGESFSLRQGESIHTENSFKYSLAEFRAMAAKAGFQKSVHWTDENDWFAVLYLS